MSEITDIGRQWLVVPAIAAEQKLSVGQIGCYRNEKFVDPPLAIGQAVGKKPEIAQKTGLGRDRIVGQRVEPVIDRHTAAGAKALVPRDDRRAAAVSQDKVVLRDQRAERIVWVGGDAVEGRRGIDIPKGGDRAGALDCRHTGFEQRIEDANATRFDDQIGIPCVFERAFDATLILGRIDDDIRPVRIGHVAMFLSIVSVGFVEGDAVSVGRERFQYAAIIGGGAVPIGRNQA